MARRKLESVCLQGNFLEKSKSEDEDGSDDSGGSDDDEWLDYDDINAMSNNPFIKSQNLKRETVQFQDYKRGHFKVNGCFPMQDPWWSAKLKVSRPRGNYCLLRGFPAYELRTDARVVTEGIVSLFLTKCEVSDDHKTDFIDAVRSWGDGSMLTLQELPDLLKKFGASSDENKAKAVQIEQNLSSDAGKMVMLCLEKGDIFVYLPQLFPRKIHWIVKKLDARKMEKLQHIIDHEPWTLGFSNVMAYKHGLSNLEASLRALIDSGLFERMSQVEKDALYIYDVMKTSCRRFGHTFLHAKTLHQSKMFGEYQVKKWREALEFLEKERVIVIEHEEDEPRLGDFTRLFLYKLWRAENTIAKAFGTLFERHKNDPWELDIDFESEEFADLQADADQKAAAELMARSPVVCLSGKGGCGKTHVVSMVFRHAQALLKRDQQRQYQEDMFNESDVDDLALTRTVDEFERTHLEQCDVSALNALKELEESQINDESIRSEIVLNHSYLPQSQGGSRYVTDMETEVYGGDGGGDAKAKSRADETQAFPEILLSAPTGKAANLLGRRSQLPSSTLHQVIFNYRAWKNKEPKDAGGRPTPWKYSQVQALVVDECSLVSVSTFSTLIDMLVDHAPLRKIVLLGDINQLPSIEPGNFLSDTFASLQRVGLSHLLRTNHRSEAHLIIDNATRISEQQPPLIDAARHFEQHTIEVQPVPGLDPSKADFGIEQDQLVRKLLKENPAMKDHTKSQFVAFRRKDCEQINETCCKHYCGHVTKDQKNKALFQVDDKVCCTKNALVRDHISNTNIRLCNGEIFFITEDIEVSDNVESSQSRRKPTRYLTLDDKENPPVKVLYHSLRRDCKLKHSWARTIHTYQGSESDTVTYVVGAGRGQTWQHVYTAVTRGKKHVIMLTRQQDLEEAIARPPGYRRTMLRTRIQDALKQLPPGIVRFQGFQKASLSTSPYKNTQQRYSHSSNQTCSTPTTNDIAEPYRLRPSISSFQAHSTPLCPFPPSRNNAPMNPNPSTYDSRSASNVPTVFKSASSEPLSSGSETLSLNQSVEQSGADSVIAKPDTSGGSQNFSDWGDSMLDEVMQNTDTQTNSIRNTGTDSISDGNCHCGPETPQCICGGNNWANDDFPIGALPLTPENDVNVASWRQTQGVRTPISPGTDEDNNDVFKTPTKGDFSAYMSPKRPREEDGLGSPSKFRRALTLDVVTSADVSPMRRKLDTCLSLNHYGKSG